MDKKVILIVSDNLDQNSALYKFLLNKDFNIDRVDNILEAVEYLNQGIYKSHGADSVNMIIFIIDRYLSEDEMRGFVSFSNNDQDLTIVELSRVEVNTIDPIDSDDKDDMFKGISLN